MIFEKMHSAQTVSHNHSVVEITSILSQNKSFLMVFSTIYDMLWAENFLVLGQLRLEC